MLITSMKLSAQNGLFIHMLNKTCLRQETLTFPEKLDTKLEGRDPKTQIEFLNIEKMKNEKLLTTVIDIKKSHQYHRCDQL